MLTNKEKQFTWGNAVFWIQITFKQEAWSWSASGSMLSVYLLDLRDDILNVCEHFNYVFTV